MKIGVDASNILMGGGRTHLLELLNSSNPEKDQFSEIIVWGSEETLQFLPEYSWIKKIYVPLLSGNILHRVYWQIFSLGKEARSKGCDILFIPGGSFTTKFRPIVTMNQNITPFQWKETRRSGISLATLRLLLLRIRQSRSFSLSDGVIFLSKFSEGVVRKKIGAIKGKTKVIPHGLNSMFLPSEEAINNKSLISLNKPIKLLYVSTIDFYKHQWNIVEGVYIARNKRNLDLKLSLVGPANPKALKRLKTTMAKFDPKGDWVSYEGAVSYNKISNKYTESDIGVWGSSSETFGLISLEMMASGLPIISSNSGPTSEILGNIAFYFNPENPKSVAEAIDELLDSKEKLQDFTKIGCERAKNYSWEKCARDTFRFLWDIAQESVFESRSNGN